MGVKDDQFDPLPDSFLELPDVPDSYSGQAGKSVTVRSLEDGLEFMEAAGGANHDFLSATHPDTLAAAVTDGSIIIGNVTSLWSELVIAVPVVNVRNVLGVDNGELRPSWKTALDSVNPEQVAVGVAPGTSLSFARRDHVHGIGDSIKGGTLSATDNTDTTVTFNTEFPGFFIPAVVASFADEQNAVDIIEVKNIDITGFTIAIHKGHGGANHTHAVHWIATDFRNI